LDPNGLAIYSKAKIGPGDGPQLLFLKGKAPDTRSKGPVLPLQVLMYPFSQRHMSHFRERDVPHFFRVGLLVLFGESAGMKRRPIPKLCLESWRGVKMTKSSSTKTAKASASGAVLPRTKATRSPPFTVSKAFFRLYFTALPAVVSGG
jgi:hypothetical protein